MAIDVHHLLGDAVAAVESGESMESMEAVMALVNAIRPRPRLWLPDCGCRRLAFPGRPGEVSAYTLKVHRGVRRYVHQSC